MRIDPSIQAEWNTTHTLGRESLDWIEAHADRGDTHPILTAVTILRAAERGERNPTLGRRNPLLRRRWLHAAHTAHRRGDVPAK